MSWFDNTQLVGFYALGVVAIIASLRVITLANPVHAILSMIVSLLALAGIFFIVGAPFAGALEVIVYAGAILVLFVFVIMMLNLGSQNDKRESSWLTADVWAVPTGLTVIIAIILYAMIAMNSPGEAAHFSEGAVVLPMMGAETIYPKQVGIRLFSEYLMLIEVAAMLLLAALVAAYHLGKKALDDENFSHISNEVGNPVDNVQGNSTQDALNNTKKNAQAYKYEPVDAKEFLKQGGTASISSSTKQNQSGSGLNLNKKEGS